MVNVYEKYKVNLPDMENEKWIVTHFTISEKLDFENLRLARDGRGISPGVYTRLHRKRADGTYDINSLVMSDTTAEIRDHLDIIDKAYGRVLLNGLGIGMVLGAVLQNPKVTHVDVVEISKELIDLIGPYYKNERISFYNADAYTIKWPKGTRWDVAWHDIWDELYENNLELMTKLHRKYGRMVDWQDSWGKSFLLRQRRNNNKYKSIFRW